MYRKAVPGTGLNIAQPQFDFCGSCVGGRGAEEKEKPLLCLEYFFLLNCSCLKWLGVWNAGINRGIDGLVCRPRER